MSLTKRWIEDLMEKGEYPYPQETRIIIDEPNAFGVCDIYKFGFSFVFNTINPKCKS